MTEEVKHDNGSFMTLEGSELRRLEQCEAELLEHRIAIGELRARMEQFQARLDALERARNQ